MLRSKETSYCTCGVFCFEVHVDKPTQPPPCSISPIARSSPLTTILILPNNHHHHYCRHHSSSTTSPKHSSIPFQHPPHRLSLISNPTAFQHPPHRLVYPSSATATPRRYSYRLHNLLATLATLAYIQANTNFRTVTHRTPRRSGTLTVSSDKRVPVYCRRLSMASPTSTSK